MKLQIWEIYVSSGLIEAIHGESYPILEGYIPELGLTINQISSFVHDKEDGENTRYKDCTAEDQLVKGTPANPPPELHCEVELTSQQVEDAKILASPGGYLERLRKVIVSALKEHNLDTSDYEEEDDDFEDDDFEDDDTEDDDTDPGPI